MKIYKSIANGVHKVSNACVWVSGIVLVLIAILICIEVIARYIFRNSILGVQEISELFIVVVLYFGLAYSTYTRSHVKVDVLINAFRPDAKMITQGICSLLCIILSAPAAVQVFKQGLICLEQGKASSLLHIAHWPFYMAAAFGLALTTLEFIFDGVRWFEEAHAWRLEHKNGNTPSEEVSK